MENKDKTSAGNIDNIQNNSISINRHEIENHLVNGGDDNQDIMEPEMHKIKKVVRKKRRKSTKRSVQKDELTNVAVNSNDN